MKTTPTLQQGSSHIIPILQTSGNVKMLQRTGLSKIPFLFRIDDVLFSALSMGSRVVRSHTLGEKNFLYFESDFKNLLRNLDWNWRVPCLWNGMEWHSVAWVSCSRGKHNYFVIQIQIKHFLRVRRTLRVLTMRCTELVNWVSSS